MSPETQREDVSSFPKIKSLKKTGSMEKIILRGKYIYQQIVLYKKRLYYQEIHITY